MTWKILDWLLVASWALFGLIYAVHWNANKLDTFDHIAALISIFFVVEHYAFKESKQS